MTRIDSYLWEEVTAPFLVGVLVILVPLLGDSLYYLMNLVIVQHVDFLTVVRLLLFLVPQMMCNAFPLATILAVSLGVGRMANEGEWTAIRLGGRSIWRMLVPLAVFGVCVGAMNWVVSEHLAPAANVQFRRTVEQISLRKPTVAIKAGTWFHPPTGDLALYVDGVDETTGVLHRLIIYTDLQSDYPTLLTAETARYQGGRFILEHVVRHVWRSDGTLQREGHSQRAVFRVDQLTQSSGEMPRMPEPTSAAQLREAVATAAKGHGRNVSAQIDLHRRYAAPVACLVLALLCVPLNLVGGRRGGYMGLLISAVLVVVYFLTLQLGVSLARTGFLNRAPLVGVWLQNIIFGLLALWLLWRQRK